MTDLTATDPTAPDSTATGSGRHPLRAALVRAWNAATWAIPPDRWIDAAVVALTTVPAAADPHTHHDPAEHRACRDQTVDELRRLHTGARTTRAAAVARRRELTDLKARVRQRAIDTLADNPELDDALRDALTAWGLPGIPTEYTVDVTVPITVTVAATGEDDARHEATALLHQRIGALGYEVSADLTAIEYTAVNG
jgi:hypothetical protein